MTLILMSLVVVTQLGNCGVRGVHGRIVRVLLLQVSGVDDIDVGGQPAGRGAAQHHLRTLRKRYTQLTRAASGPSKAISLIEKALGPVALKKTCGFWLKMEAEVQQKWDRAAKQSSSWPWQPGAGTGDFSGSDVGRILKFLNSGVTSEEDVK